MFWSIGETRYVNFKNHLSNFVPKNSKILEQKVDVLVSNVKQKHINQSSIHIGMIFTTRG